MPGCFMMLENVLRELPKLEGIVCFSAFMLPPGTKERTALYARVLSAGATLHAALENLSLRSEAEIPQFEDLLGAAFLLERVPLRGRYEKTERALAEADDPFLRALRGTLGTFVTERM